mgnify:CR=1 FL=1
MFKLALVAIAAAYFVVPAQAHAINLPQFWTADGYREVSAGNNSAITYLPVSAGNFDSMARCESFIDEQNALAAGTNIKGYAGKQRVVATCSQQR